MKKEDILNGLIAADDLHWCDEEQKYILLTMEEVDGILQACADNGMTEEDMKYIMNIVKWCEKLRAGQLLWKNFVAGHICVEGFDNLDEPLFSKCSVE
jgi:hypothetical protein